MSGTRRASAVEAIEAGAMRDMTHGVMFGYLTDYVNMTIGDVTIGNS